ncbi:low temperature requirement protein A [Corynebacterium choanae]|uniref:Bacterial low temperature requirement A protein (LtrA) n=1 Tax=Corynebacterium choanae TaxID=1862358 RepID=A0A3G6J603_9CORY|nr:low temperature requirement protein A [Corynebacterium choanae]AZA13497.1 Bacterial low temperature requirement A protein (LtrA) [Corynebacterium choanae]
MTGLSTAHNRRRWHLPAMVPRDRHEPGRTATVLELFFDLVFVITVAINGSQLHHALTEGHLSHGLLSFAICFFGTWWAWMNFTWFASAFDTDDWFYRLLTFNQMAGVMVFAVGIEPAYTSGDFRIVIAGYVIMRLSMVVQWWRASQCGGDAGRGAKTYAIGIACVQMLWILWTFLPAGSLTNALLGVLIFAEILVPTIAERRGATSWHMHHIAERYGLFTIILLGESLLASVNALVDAREHGDHLLPLGVFALTALGITAALWWWYFWTPHHKAMHTLGSIFFFGYVHYFVFGAAAMLSAGMEANIDVLTGNSALTSRQAVLTVAMPIAVFLLGIVATSIRQAGQPTVLITTIAVAVIVVLLGLFGAPLWTLPILLFACIPVLIRNPAPEDQ